VAQGSDNLETVYTNKAMKAYVVKDFSGAIQYLEQVLQVNPGNAQANKLLALCYYNRAEQYFAKGEAQMAQEQLDQLFTYDPENAKGKALAAKIQRALAPKVVVQPRQEYVAPPPPPQPVAPQQIVIQAPAQGEGSEAMLQGFLASLDRSNKDAGAAQRYSDSLRAVEQQRMVDMLKNSAQEGAASSQNTILIVSGIVAGLVLIVVLIIVVVVRSSLKSSQKFQQQNQEVIQQLLLTAATSAMHGQNGGAPQLLLAGPGGSTPGQQASTDAQVVSSAENKLESHDDKERADAVEKVAAEIAAAPTSPGNIAKLEKLKVLLDDSSNRVRANTAFVLFKYYPDLALKTLGNMVESGSKRMAASAIWSLGEINTREAFEILKSPSIDKSDEIITHNLLTSARKIQQKASFAMSDEEKLHLVELIESLEN
jgi:type II secretory pathway pseudopilin PulG